MADETVIYRADHVLEYPFVRSVGPVVGAFLTGLRDGKVVGIKGSGGRVIVPPTEYDPETGEETSGVVDVGPEGTVTSWSWAGSLGTSTRCPSPSRGCWCSSTAPTRRSSTYCRPRRPTRCRRDAGAAAVPARGRTGRSCQGHRTLRGGGRCVVSEREPVTMMDAATKLDYVFTAGVA